MSQDLHAHFSEPRRTGMRWRVLSRAVRRPEVIVFLAAALCLLLGLSRAGSIYPVDYGQYEAVLKQCGLTWTEADMAQGGLQYARPITVFQYAHFSWSNLLTPQAGGGLVYLTALCRLVTEPFGLPFSLDALAFAEAALLALAAAVLARGLRTLIPRVWYWPVVVLCGVFADGNFCVMLRSLYPEGAAIAFSLLLAALIFHAFSLPPRQRVFRLAPVIALSFVTLKTFSPLLVFLPLILAADAVLVFSCREALKKKLLLLACCAVLLVTGCASAVTSALEDPDYFSNAAVYESAFNVILPASDEPERMLAQWGLDASYAADIGKSYYEEESAYVHNPRDEAEAEKLFSLLTPGAVLKTCVQNPPLLFQLLNRLPVSLNTGFESRRNLALSANEKGFLAFRAQNGRLTALWCFLPHSWGLFLLMQGGLLLGSLCWAILRKKKKALWFSLYSCCALLYLPFCVLLNGYSQSQQYALFQVFLEMTLWTECLCLLAFALPTARQWITRYAAEPYRLELLAPAPVSGKRSGGKIGQAVRQWTAAFAGSRNRVMLFTAAASCLILICVFLPAAHPASVNNGDFGRMMAQMDLTWPGNVFYDAQAQMGHAAIEEYAYLRAYDPLKLTPLKPTYSLFWFASVVRLLTEPFGLPFSTLLLAWIMGLISTVCLVSFVRDLYPLLKKGTLAAAALLCVILYSETYLTWYNSLYGEGCILLGLLLTLMCAVHLCVMPRKKSWKQPAWLLGLFLSLNILITAKSQMVMALPGGVLLFLVLCWYHRPYRYDLQAVQALISLALCGVLAFSGVGVYQTDRTEDSVSQKHTMWQAYFYGIFMISDDPIGDMEALGVDTAMAPDIGKYVDFSDDSQYVYAPLSQEAEEAFYNHVSMTSIITWYLTHPVKLWQMLDHAAQESQRLYTDFRVYSGQDYSLFSHDEVNGWNLWPGWRSWLTPGSFLGYVLYYGALVILCVWYMLQKNRPQWKRMLCAVPLFLIVTGALQFPLSVLGNGFADNQKQLFCFSLCHDLLLGGTLLLAGRGLIRLHAAAGPKRSAGNSNEKKGWGKALSRRS